MQGSFAGRGIAVTLGGRAAALAKPLVAGLRQAGARPVVLTDNTDGLKEIGGNHVFAVDFDSRASWQESLLLAEQEVGALSVVVHCVLPAHACAPATFVGLSPERWSSSCRFALTSTLRLLQAASTHFAARKAVLVGLGPTIALTGSPYLAPLCAALEGQRALFKSAARQWGGRGVCLSWIMAAAESFTPALDEVHAPRRPDPIPIALDRRPNLATAVVPALELLAGPSARHLTGMCFCIDGGEWMVP